MLQILSIARAQGRAGNTTESLLIKIKKSYILCIKKKILLKKYITVWLI